MYRLCSDGDAGVEGSGSWRSVLGFDVEGEARAGGVCGVCYPLQVVCSAATVLASICICFQNL